MLSEAVVQVGARQQTKRTFDCSGSEHEEIFITLLTLNTSAACKFKQMCRTLIKFIRVLKKLIQYTESSTLCKYKWHLRVSPKDIKTVIADSK